MHCIHLVTHHVISRVRIQLGWVLSGPIYIDNPSSATTLASHTLRVDSHSQREASLMLETQLKAFWELESMGIQGEDKSVIEMFEDSVTFNNGRYEVCLPWKDPEGTIPNNYQLSIRRLKNLISRLRKSPQTLKMYNDVIRDQLSQGIVQVVKEPTAETGTRVHYLPHHAVLRHDKEATKLRMVYDASARDKGPSLRNDSLYAGPKFNQLILDILSRFRLHHVALTADIEKAFLMVGVADRDQDVLRFLWYKNVYAEEPEIEVLRFSRVVFGVTSSPFLFIERHHKSPSEAIQ